MSSVADRILGRLLRLAFVFEPLTPTAVTFYLNRRLGVLKSQGLILDYSAKTARLGVFHYRIQLELGVNKRQVAYAFEHLPLLKEIESLRRWLNV